MTHRRKYIINCSSLLLFSYFTFERERVRLRERERKRGGREEGEGRGRGRERTERKSLGRNFIIRKLNEPTVYYPLPQILTLIIVYTS